MPRIDDERTEISLVGGGFKTYSVPTMRQTAHLSGPPTGQVRACLPSNRAANYSVAEVRRAPCLNSGGTRQADAGRLRRAPHAFLDYLDRSAPTSSESHLSDDLAVPMSGNADWDFLNRPDRGSRAGQSIEAVCGERRPALANSYARRFGESPSYRVCDKAKSGSVPTFSLLPHGCRPFPSGRFRYAFFHRRAARR